MSDLGGMRALVTGASSGIGAAIARELAARGVDLVLTARRWNELEKVAAECAGVETDVITADLGHPDAASTLWLAATGRRPIDILVNNAGFGYFRRFEDTDWVRDAELVQLNITSLVHLSRLFVNSKGLHPSPPAEPAGPPPRPGARQGQAGRGYLLNIASIGAYQSVPNMALYSASKAFVRNFTEGLHDELAGSPLSATCVCPGGTKTEFHAMAGAGNYGWVANASMMTAEQVAAIAVRAMERGKRTVIPGVVNKLSCWSVRLVPRWFASWMSRRVLGTPRPGALPARTRGAA